MSRPWSTVEVAYLKRYKSRGLEACAAALGRPLSGVQNMSTKLFRKKHPIRWHGYGAGRATA